MAQTKQHQYDDDSQLAYFAQQDAETGRVRKVQYVNGVEQPLLNEGGASDEAHAIGYAAADAPPRRLVIFVTMCIFMGYATLNALQHKIKVIFGIKDNTDPRSLEFSYAVSCLYLGNLVFRLMHNIVFACLIPRHRVFVSFILMACSMSILGVFVFLLEIKQMAIVFAAYFMGGVSIGTFESNLLSSISPLGHATKTWAVIGIPVGYNLINIGAFVAFALDPSNRYLQFSIYCVVCVSVVLGALLFRFGIPAHNVKQNDEFVKNMKEVCTWVPKIKFNAAALNIDMFAVAMFSGIMMYIWDHDEVPLFGPNSHVIISHNTFIAVYNTLTFLGDAISRKVAYVYRPVNPLFFNILSVLGAAMCLSKIAVLAWPGIFLIFFANGSIYATTTRHVDNHVMKGHSLVALSFWLFTGDCGSVIGSLLLIHVKVWIGPVACWTCTPSYGG